MIGRLGAASFLLLSLVLVGLALHAVWALAQNNHSLSEVESKNNLVELYHSAEVALLRAEATGERFTASGSDQDRSELEASVADVISALTRLAVLGDEAELALAGQIFSEYAGDFEALTGYLDAVQAGTSPAFQFDSETVPAIAAQLGTRRAAVDAESATSLAGFESRLNAQLYVALAVFGLGLPLAMGAMLLLPWYQRKERIAEIKLASLSAISRVDSLTGVGNHRAFHEYFAKEANNARRGRKVLTLALLDLDYFKKVNDELGHAEGDFLLASFGALLQSANREEGFGRVEAFRLGGDEFALLMPSIDDQQAERLVGVLRRRGLEFVGAPTFSVGVASSEGESVDVQELRARADSSLYLAKRRGRDLVVNSGQSPVAAA